MLAKKIDHLPKIELYKNYLIKEEVLEREKMINKYYPLIDKSRLSQKFLESSDFNNYSMIGTYEHVWQPLQGNVDDFVNENSKIIPSVTNILKLGQPPSQALLKWKLATMRSLGIEGYLNLVKSYKVYGNKFHTFIENKLDRLELEKSELFEPNLIKLVPILRDINKIMLIEADVVNRALFYKGRIDLLAYYKNDLCLIDWKTSSQRKLSVRSLYDNPIQLAAYVGALLHDKRFEFLQNGEHTLKYAIIINFQKGKGEIDVHKFDLNELRPYWIKWLQLMKMFWSNVSNKNILSE